MPEQSAYQLQETVLKNDDVCTAHLLWITVSGCEDFERPFFIPSASNILGIVQTDDVLV